MGGRERHGAGLLDQGWAGNFPNDKILPSPGEGYHLINWMDVDAKLESPTIDGTAETPLLVSEGCYGYAHDALITNSPPDVNNSPDTFDITYRVRGS